MCGFALKLCHVQIIVSQCAFSVEFVKLQFGALSFSCGVVAILQSCRQPKRRLSSFEHSRMKLSAACNCVIWKFCCWACLRLLNLENEYSAWWKFEKNQFFFLTIDELYFKIYLILISITIVITIVLHCVWIRFGIEGWMGWDFTLEIGIDYIVSQLGWWVFSVN
jgi:hypothetical protein